MAIDSMRVPSLRATLGARDAGDSPVQHYHWSCLHVFDSRGREMQRVVRPPDIVYSTTTFRGQSVPSLELHASSDGRSPTKTLAC